MDLGERAAWLRFLIRDRGSKVTATFDAFLAWNGAQVIKTPVGSPRANAFAERLVGTLRRECLDHMLIPGERHLRRNPCSGSPAKPSISASGSSAGKPLAA
jgi:putative transposase